MIQELFAGSNLIPGERKFSINGTSSSVLLPPTPSPSSTTTSTLTTTTTTTPTSTINSENQNLRCPRCDSSNTKFCYYNNYNLTQPRHFCKTCRRYWTKGGALRNVPIGGGCRKNKNVGVSNSVAKATTTTKMKAVVASELGRSGLTSGFEHELQVQPSQILWGSPQNTHLLALLRSSHSHSHSQNQNPNPNPSSMTIKEEGNNNNLMGTTHQSHMVTTEPLIGNGLLSIPRTTLVGFDGGVGQVLPSLGLCSSLWRNNNNHQDQPHHQQQNSGFVLGENQSSGIQELYHKLRSASSSNYCSDSTTMFMGDMASNNSNSSSSSSLSTILESSSVVGGGELGCWMNPTLPWSCDLPTTTTNGAYP